MSINTTMVMHLLRQSQQPVSLNMVTAKSIPRKPTLRFSAYQVSMLLTIVALILLSIGIIQAKFEIGKYGLIHGFPPIFFIALGTLTLASALLWRAKENRGKLLALQLSILVAAIWLAPNVVGGAQSLYAVAYGDLGYTEHIFREGSTFPSELWQHNWPANYILQASTLQITGSDMDDFADFLPWLPIIWQFILFFPVYVFLRNIIGKSKPNYIWAGMWLFYLFNWIGVQNNGAQPFGVFCVFSVFAILTRPPFIKKRGLAFATKLNIVLIFATVTVTHMLASIVTVFVSGMLYITRRLSLAKWMIVGAIFIAAWATYGANTYFEWKLEAFWNQSFRIGEAVESGVAAPLFGNESHAAVSIVRIIISSIIVVIAALGWFVGYKRYRKNQYDVTVFAIFAGCILAGTIVGSGYRHELFERFYLFMLPGLAYFGVKLLTLRRTTIVLTLLLIIGLPLTFVAQHGNQEMDYLTEGYLSGAHFFHDNTTHGWVDGDRPMGWMANMEDYWTPASYEQLRWVGNELAPEGRRFVDGAYDYTPDYICISDHDRAFQSYFYNRPDRIDDLEIELNDTTNCNLTFANASMELYIHEEHPYE